MATWQRACPELLGSQEGISWIKRESMNHLPSHEIIEFNRKRRREVTDAIAFAFASAKSSHGQQWLCELFLLRPSLISIQRSRWTLQRVSQLASTSTKYYTPSLFTLRTRSYSRSARCGLRVNNFISSIVAFAPTRRRYHCYWSQLTYLMLRRS
jgi:hypothetical protein